MVTRRKFLQQSSILAGALMINKTNFLQMHKDVGLQLYTVREEIKDLKNTLQKISAAGYTNVEMYGYDYKDRKFFGNTVTEMGELLKQDNLKTFSGHYLLQDFLYDKEYNMDSWKYLLDDANILKHKYVTIPYVDDKHRTEDNFKLIAERLQRGGELSKAAGLITAYHNHNFEFDKTADGKTFYEILLDNTDPELVKFEMDLYWVANAGQNPYDWFKKYPGRFPMWHIKDMEASAAGAPKGQTCEVGKGIIDWKSIFKHQKLAGLDYAFVEQEQYRRPVFDCIKTSADYMKTNLLK